MTEERFEQIIEDAADKFDRSMNGAWKHRPVRFVGKAISLFAGAGLVASAVPLAEKGNDLAAKVCLVSGGLIVLFDMLQFIIFKKK